MTFETDRPSDYAQGIRQKMKLRVIAQQRAIDALADSLEVREAGLAPERPTSMLLMGPTGVGKTHFVEELSKVLHRSESPCFIKIDCAEYGRDHEVSKLIGSPPGYLGHSRGPDAATTGTPAILSQANIEGCRSATSDVAIVLFDEIEKAAGDMHRLLLGVLDRGTLTLGTNETVLFRNTLILMTSNLGVKEMHQLESPGVGFGVGAKAVSAAQRQRCSVEAARKKFPPEFFNRIDEVVMFDPLGNDALSAILDLAVADLAARSKMAIDLAPGARKAILEDGYDPRYGARHLHRSIAKRLQRPMARLILQGCTDDVVFVNDDFEFVTARAQTAKAGR